jgi:curli biogenesis system outer membrane secretion channel CsgG
MLKKTLTFLILLLLVSSALLAQGKAKVRIAVVDFENRSTWHWWGDRLGEAAADVFVTDLLDTGKFSVIEREKLEAVLREQNLGASGLVTPETAVRVGKLLGVQYILTGSVTEFAISQTGGGFRGVGVKVTTGKVVLNARLVNTTTGEIELAKEADNNKRLVGAHVKGARFYQNYDYGLAHEVMHPAVEKVVEQISVKVGDLSTLVAKGKVIKVSEAGVYINIGANYGVQLGDVFEVIRKGEELVDPDTGLSLGAEEEKVGTIEVIKIEEKYAVCKIVSGEPQANDTIKKKQ